METLGEAASRLLAGMARRAEEARPLAENARPFLRLVAANDERRDREGTPRPIPQFADREEEVGVREFDAMALGADADMD
jgi:hypothetical protein